MTLSAFDVIGPVMVGPSSSHTAGAARIGLAARLLLGETPLSVRFGLHGSFAATGQGHATDRALLAGMLGDSPDNKALPESFERARNAGLQFEFAAIDLGDEAHPNSVRIEAASATRQLTMTAASVGGGVVVIREIDGHGTALSGARPTLVCWHSDQRGFLAALTALFAQVAVNIASISTSRKSRGGAALTVAEADEAIPPTLPQEAARLPGVTRVILLPSLP
ncbi:MAG TPA: L-serine ammonia-lyase, iron-sulfur-dependent subunit beta [Opitutaceae bacterium]|nr:L-serine ammonia-lyase, iron-sulfur-dependent subunit beta [Opitutaceae bacterium]